VGHEVDMAAYMKTQSAILAEISLESKVSFDLIIF
jgi:hypothetical protein